MLIRTLALTSTLLLANGTVTADQTIEESLDKLCNTMKSCTLAELEAEGEMSAAMKNMVEQMSAQVCQHMDSTFLGMPDDEALQKQAQACIDSMTSMSCKALEEMGDNDTPECKAFESMAKKYE